MHRLLILFLLSCRSQSSELSDLNLDSELSFKVLSQGQRDISNNTARSYGSYEKIRYCVDRINQLGASLKRLSSYLDQRRFAAMPLGIAKQLTVMRPSHCTGPSIKKVLTLVHKVSNNHNRVVAVLLPLTGVHAPYGKAILAGLRTAVAPSIELVIKDIATANFERSLAQSIFENNASMIVGGLSLEQSQYISKISSELSMPSFIFNQDLALSEVDEYLFRVYPTDSELARRTLENANERGFKRIAILQSEKTESLALIDHIQKLSPQHDIQVQTPITYKPLDYESMDNAVRVLNHIDLKERRHEYQKLFEEARVLAEQNHVAFDPRSVILPPVVEYDAIMIPDEITIVRHFVKLLKYHGIEKMPLIGNQQWREQSVIKPWDDFMEGSYFVDFIGSYKRLPAPLQDQAKSLPSEYFPSLDQMVDIDFQLIGLRTGDILNQTFEKPYYKKQYLAKQILELKVKPTNEPQFYDNHNVRWPTFILNVSQSAISAR